MSGINKAILIGRLGRDPEIKTFENGAKRASFSIATSDFYKDKEGNKVEQTEWHNIVCWRGLAEIAERYLTKGRLIYVEGKLRTRSWEDNGSKRYITEIEANNFTMLSAKSEESAPAVTEYKNRNEAVAALINAPAPKTAPAEDLTEIQPTDDLPF